MDVFALLIPNILPLYALIALGYIGGRWLGIDLGSVARVNIYLIMPFVYMGSMMRLDLDPAFALLPIMILACSMTIGITLYRFAQHRWRDTSANLIGMSSVTGNTGYSGYPIVLALFGPDEAGTHLIMSLAYAIAEVTFGYYFGARGHASVREALLKIVKLPMIHGIWIGLFFNFVGVPMPEIVNRYTAYATGAWICLGMMLIGIAIGKQAKITIDWRLIRWLYSVKFLLWPLVIFTIVIADRAVFHLFDPSIHQMLAILCAVPLAGNLVAYAANLNLHPDRIAGAVLLSNFVGLFSVPLALTLYRYYENM